MTPNQFPDGFTNLVVNYGRANLMPCFPEPEVVCILHGGVIWHARQMHAVLAVSERGEGVTDGRSHHRNSRVIAKKSRHTSGLISIIIEVT